MGCHMGCHYGMPNLLYIISNMGCPFKPPLLRFKRGLWAEGPSLRPKAEQGFLGCPK